MCIEPLRELTWGGGIPGIFVGEQVFLLDEIGPDRTCLVQKEDFVGLLIPFAELDSMEEGYKQMNRMLKIRAEMQ